jgi:hypothetical protein
MMFRHFRSVKGASPLNPEVAMVFSIYLVRGRNPPHSDRPGYERGL